ncbi:hypothetical protein P7C70_g8712, partial [Phenoliferia sp. Uapishka_3]
MDPSSSISSTSTLRPKPQQVGLPSSPINSFESSTNATKRSQLASSSAHFSSPPPAQRPRLMSENGDHNMDQEPLEWELDMEEGELWIERVEVQTGASGRKSLLEPMLSTAVRDGLKAYRVLLGDEGSCLSGIASLEEHVASGTLPKALAASSKVVPPHYLPRYTSADSFQAEMDTANTAAKNAAISSLMRDLRVRKDELSLIQSKLVEATFIQDWHSAQKAEITSLAAEANVPADSFLRELQKHLALLRSTLWDERVTRTQHKRKVAKEAADKLAKATAARALVNAAAAPFVDKSVEEVVKFHMAKGQKELKAVQKQLATLLSSKKAGPSPAQTAKPSGNAGVSTDKGSKKSKSKSPNQAASAPSVTKPKDGEFLSVFPRLCRSPAALNAQRARQAKRRKDQRRRKVAEREVGKLSDGLDLDWRNLECKPGFNVRRPFSFPDSFIRLSDPDAAKFVISKSTCLFLDTRISNVGIQNPFGLFIPPEVERFLSYNFKFIPKPKLDLTGPMLSWEELCRSVRIRWFFRDEETRKDFNPRFHIARPDFMPIRARPDIEAGLERGRESLSTQLSVANFAPIHANVSNKMISGLLDLYKNGEILIKPSDKNLGPCILPIDWYVGECMRQLSDTTTYELVDSAPTQLMHTWLQKYLTDVSDTIGTGAFAFEFTGQDIKFLRDLTVDNAKLPEFYITPKVHKPPPLKGRPIIPSHSWITANVSTFLDAKLQPLLSWFPWILRDSKQLIRELSELVLPIPKEGEQVWLVTGDVRAMYTNIPTVEGIEVVCDFVESFYGLAVSKVFSSLLHFVLDNNYFTFLGGTYRQTNGTAMGTSCSVVYANLFCASPELDLSSEGVSPFYYKRFVDDLFSIVVGTEGDVHKFCTAYGNLHPALTIDWVFDACQVNFLDVTVRLRSDHGSSRQFFQTEVYQKPMNSYQYIPWLSYHPVTVKRAFVKGVLLGYARGSSRYVDFVKSRMRFYLRLRARGYPPRWLNKNFAIVNWHRDRAQTLVDREKPDPSGRGPLIYKAKYNPVWDYIHMPTVWKQTFGHLLSRELPFLLGDSHLRPIRAMARPKSLGDRLNGLNKATLKGIRVSSRHIGKKSSFRAPHLFP